MDPTANSAGFQGISRFGPIDGDVTPPRVSNVGALGNTSVLVTFSEPVQTAGAENPAHCRIVGAHEALTRSELETLRATLTVIYAKLGASRTAVVLTTMAMSDIEYVIAVTNVQDLAGNQIAPPELGVPYPSALRFFGIPGSGRVIGSDCDGVPDAVELRGWVVSVVTVDSRTETREATSDPGDPRLSCEENAAARDTNQDGVDDYQKCLHRLDPRSADTDGDGFSDSDEVMLQNRNPLVADLPIFDIQVVGDVQLGLDVRCTAESTSGGRFLEQRSSTANLSTSDGTTNTRSNESASEWFINAGINLMVGYYAGLKFEVGGKVEGGYKESTSATFTNESVRQTQREQGTSMTSDRELTDGETLSREVVGASMAIALVIVNRNDIAFTISNIEITAKIRDPGDPSRFAAVATLVGNSGSISVGPASASREPLRFTAIDITPSLIEELRIDARGIDTCTAAQRLVIDSSYSTRTIGGREELWRVRSVVANVADKLAWFVFVPHGTIRNDFRDLQLTSGQVFQLILAQDLDGDGLTARDAALFGSVDSTVDVLDNACLGTTPFPADECVQAGASGPPSPTTAAPTPTATASPASKGRRAGTSPSSAPPATSCSANRTRTPWRTRTAASCRRRWCWRPASRSGRCPTP